ncbi:MAG: CoA transferase subunit A, partial [Methylosarcina sp.]
TSCYPFYAYDRPHTQMYYSAAKLGDQEFRTDYLKRYVYDCPTHSDYIFALGGETALSRLSRWRSCAEEWMELYA